MTNSVVAAQVYLDEDDSFPVNERGILQMFDTALGGHTTVKSILNTGEDKDNFMQNFDVFYNKIIEFERQNVETNALFKIG